MKGRDPKEDFDIEFFSRLARMHPKTMHHFCLED